MAVYTNFAPLGTPVAGDIPVYQANGSVMWETPAPAPSGSIAYLYFGGEQGAWAGGGFLGPWLQVGQAAENTGQVPSPKTGTVKNLRIRLLDNGLIAGDPFIITVRVEGANTLITCAIAVGDNSAADLVNTAAIVVGQYVSIEVTNAGNPVAANSFYATIEIE